MRGRESGYSLIEMLIVTVVLSIIVSIALVTVWNALDRAKQRATMADMRTIARAIEVYHSDHGFVPLSSVGMEGLRQVLIPYQANVLPVRDHWGHDLAYTADPVTGRYSIESFGKDGVDGPDITLATRLQFRDDIVLANGRFVASPE